MAKVGTKASGPLSGLLKSLSKKAAKAAAPKAPAKAAAPKAPAKQAVSKTSPKPAAASLPAPAKTDTLTIKGPSAITRALQAAPATPEAIQAKIQALLGPGVKFATEGGAQWTVAEAQQLLQVVESIPPKDRAALANTTFTRVKELPPHEGESRPDYGQAQVLTDDVGGKAVVKLADIASAEGVFSKVAAHEMAHIVQGKGRWDNNAIREFAKLSHFERPGTPPALANGYNESHGQDTYDTSRPTNTGNFVSDYAKASPAEDFAESYRVYLADPKLLMEKSPEKFLYINADSGKYGSVEVAELAKQAGVDLPLAMAELKRGNVRPETMAKIAAAHGLGNAGDAGTAAGDAIARIQDNVDNPAFVSRLKADPAGALEGIWDKLSPAEQQLLRKPSYVENVLATVKANKAAPKDSVSDQEAAAWKDWAMHMVTRNPGFWDKLGMMFTSKRVDYFNEQIHKPEFWNRFSPETRALIDSPQGQAAIKYLVSAPEITTVMKRLFGGVKVPIIGWVGGKPDEAGQKKLQNVVSHMGAAEAQFMVDLLKQGASNQSQAKETMKELIAGVVYSMDHGSFPTVSKPGY